MVEKTMGDRIRELRKKHNFTQEDLAVILHTTKSSISAYENNKVDIKSSVILELSNVLLINPDYLFGIDDLDKEDKVLIEAMYLLKKLKSEKFKKAVLIQIQVVVDLEN